MEGYGTEWQGIRETGLPTIRELVKFENANFDGSAGGAISRWFESADGVIRELTAEEFHEMEAIAELVDVELTIRVNMEHVMSRFNTEPIDIEATRDNWLRAAKEALEKALPGAYISTSIVPAVNEWIEGLPDFFDEQDCYECEQLVSDAFDDETMWVMAKKL